MALKLENEKIEKIRDFLTWAAIASLVLWVFAKSFGWINSPVIVEQYPILVAAFVAGAFFQEFREFKKEMKAFKREMREFKTDTKENFRKVNEKFDTHNARINSLELKAV